MKNAVWLIVVAGVLGLLFYNIDTSPEGRRDREQRTQERATIAACGEAQNDELSELSARRMMRQACDKMQAEYDKKWRGR